MYFGGGFTNAGGLNIPALARWDGSGVLDFVDTQAADLPQRFYRARQVPYPPLLVNLCSLWTTSVQLVRV